MSFTLSYPFNSESNYVFDSAKIEVTGGLAKLKLINNPGQDFVQNFTNDTGFIYDSNLVEFVGGVMRQKDQRPANSVIAAKFTSSLDANWAADSFVDSSHTANGTPVLSSGKVDCVGSNGLYYSDALIGALSGDWVAKFKYTPHYTSGPATNVNIFALSQTSGSTDQVIIFNSPAGNNLRISANGLSASSFGAWSPVAEQEYVFEVFCASNIVTLWVDGVQIGTGKTISPGQGTTANRAWLGAYVNAYNIANASFDDFILYSTAAQDENYTIPEKTYLASYVTLPEMEYTGVGTLISFDTFTTTESGSPRYTLQIARSGDYLYWNSPAWVVSDNTYAQSTTTADFNTNSTSLDVNGEIYGQFRVSFTDSNTQSSVDTLTASLTAQIYPTDNPTIIPTTSITMEELINYTATTNQAGSDIVKYTLKKGNSFYYYNGSAWVVADDTYVQTNTLAEIQANVTTFTTVGITFKWKAFLHSDDGSTTPDIDIITVEYDFFETGEDIDVCIVWGYNKNNGGAADDSSFTVQLSRDAIKYKNETIVRDDLITVTPDSSTGYWEIELIENANMSGIAYYNFTFDEQIYHRIVPNEASKNFWDLVEA